MGFAGHKKAPPNAEKRKVTPLFIKQVQAALKANDVYNTQHRLKKGERGYRPSSHQDLAEALDVDPNSIKNLLGGVRAGTNVKSPKTSRLVDPICELLGIEPIVDVPVPSSLAGLVSRLRSLPPDRIAEISAQVADAEKKK